MVSFGGPYVRVRVARGAHLLTYYHIQAIGNH